MMEKTTKKAMISTNYCDSLVGDVRERYIQKTAKIQIDPYKLPAEAFSDDRTKWPEISYVDVVHFLIFQQSAYTKDQLKNYKSLDAYKLFQDGWIQEILHKEINGVHLLRAKVTHSMRVREKPLQPWVIVGTDGSVETAYCTCMAGLGECCTHVAAVLFALESGARICKEATVTDVPAYRMFPTSSKFETPYKRIKDMDFQSAVKKRQLSNNDSVHIVSKKQAVSDIPSPTANEAILFWDELHHNLPKAAVLSLRGKGKFSENFKPKSLFAEWPIDLGQVCLCSKDTSNLDSSYEQVLDKCNTIDISVSKEQASYLEKETRGQSNSLFWHRYRRGRITASNFYSACHTSISQPSLTALKTICSSYGNKMPFYSAATAWGTKHEPTAKMEYSALVKSKHVNYTLVDSGLIINERYPQFGASPDGMISCVCCGDGCLEIKCPYSMKDKPVLDVPWLRLINSKLTIDCKHSYYYQMQMQIFCQTDSIVTFMYGALMTTTMNVLIETMNCGKQCIIKLWSFTPNV